VPPIPASPPPGCALQVLRTRERVRAPPFFFPLHPPLPSLLRAGLVAADEGAAGGGRREHGGAHQRGRMVVRRERVAAVAGQHFPHARRALRRPLRHRACKPVLPSPTPVFDLSKFCDQIGICADFSWYVAQLRCAGLLRLCIIVKQSANLGRNRGAGL
jgi:hypothetical protein